MLKIATWNVNSLRMRISHVLKWLEENKPEVLALQETKTPDDQFPKEALESSGYHVIYSGQKTYNGVAILSRASVTEVIKEIPGFPDVERRVLGCTLKDKVRIINVYAPNGSSVGSDKYQYKLSWFAHLHDYLKDQLNKYQACIVLGDFNVAPENRDVYDPKAWEGQVLVSPKERHALSRLLQLGMKDVFRLFDQPEKSYSWWDYRMLAFPRNHGLRLDLVLANDKLADNCLSCVIDRNPRKWEKPSDHTVVAATFKLSLHSET